MISSMRDPFRLDKGSLPLTKPTTNMTTIVFFLANTNGLISSVIMVENTALKASVSSWYDWALHKVNQSMSVKSTFSLVY